MAIAIPLEQLRVELRKRRREEELSLQSVEAATGVSASTLSRLERGMLPNVEIIEKVASWLGVNVQAGADTGGEIQTDEELIQAIEVHLRANKNLEEHVARAIAKSYEVVMRLELEKERAKKTRR